MDNKRPGGGSEISERSSPSQGKEEMRWPTREELRASREHMKAMHADVKRFVEETEREVEEDRKAGHVPDPAEIDMDLWKKRYAKIIKDYPPPEYLLPGIAAKFSKYLED